MSIHYLLFIPLVLLASSKVLLQGMISRNYLKNATDVTLYNSMVFGGMTVIYLVFNGMNIPNPRLLPYGIAYGLLLAAYQVFYTLAFQRGPVSHTALIVTFNNVFAITFGILYCNETLSLINVIGLAAMLLSLVLTVDFKQSKAHQFSFTWFILSLSAMTVMGISNIVLKLQKMTVPGSDISMLLITYFFGTVGLFLFYLFQSKVLKQKKMVILLRSRVIAIMTVSVILGAYFILYMLGVGSIPSVVFFPVVNIAPTTMISVFGILVFKDRLSLQQKWSMFFGITATVLLCL